MSKAGVGNTFEDFTVGQMLRHASPVTMTAAHAVQFQAYYGSRFALNLSDDAAISVGYDRAPLANMLVFHTVFGKSVPDISLNAIANLGYADVRFLGPVYPGDTLFAASEVIGLRENSNGRSGIVYVHTSAINQHGAPIVSFKRWVMVRKRDAASAAPTPVLPELHAAVAAEAIALAPAVRIPRATFDGDLSGSRDAWDDYEVGEVLAHGATVELASDHMNATRFLGHNTAAVHFDSARTGTGRRLIYGGHVMQHVLAMSHDGLANALDVVAINGGTHTAPASEGDRLGAYSTIIAKAALPGRDDIALLRVRSVGLVLERPLAPGETPYRIADPQRDGRETYDPRVVLDLDYWLAMPTAKSMQAPGRSAPANHRLSARASDPVFRAVPRAERMVHFFPPHIAKVREKAAQMVAAATVDVLLGNFEDGVANGDKVAARAGFIEFARATAMGDVGLWIRTNQIWASDGHESALFTADIGDVVATVGAKLDVVMVPKVETAADIRHVHKRLTVLEAEHGLTRPIRIHAILETAKGIVNVNAIAAASPRMHGLSFGPADYAADMGLKTTVVGGTVVGYETIGPKVERGPEVEDGPEVEGSSDAGRQRTQQDVWHYHIAAMVAACRAAGIKPMFGPFGAILDPTACSVQFRNAYLMGMEGAWSLHPTQITIAKSVFSPSAAEVAGARRIIAALPEDGSGAAMDDKGNFLDDAVIKQARVILAVAEQVAARDPAFAEAYRA